MLTSTDRILTTHAGSLPRDRELTALHVRASRGEPVDPEEMARVVDEATRRVVAAQLAAGIDVGNDGEQPRESFFTYVRLRMTGFGGHSLRALMRDLTVFPGFLQLRVLARGTEMVNLMTA